jgi:hypothetical protein
LSIVGQTFLIKFSLEILECKSIVEDGDIASWRGIEVHGNITLLDWSGGSEAGCKHREKRWVTHFEEVYKDGGIALRSVGR